jgi:glycosyltransferase involved in cell wall biosynthesis
MKTALILAGCPHATVTLYRCVHLQEQLAALGIQATVQEWHDQPLPTTTGISYDLLVLQRVAMTANLRAWIDAMQRAGKPVIFDADDLVFEPAMTGWHRGTARLTSLERTQYDDGVVRTLATLEAADFVLTASDLLAELAERRGKRAFVHRNAVGQAMQAVGDRLWAGRQSAPSPDATSRVVIGYGSGTPTHDADFAVVVPALLDLLARYPQVELWLVGPLEVPPALATFGARIRRYPLMAWQPYLELASHFDIALAPLESENLFCRAKSEIKFVEAGLVGVPTVAARSDAFAHAIEHGVDGLLASHTAEWISGLATLITQPALRQMLGAAARRKIETHYSYAARTRDLAQVLARIEGCAQRAPARGERREVGGDEPLTVNHLPLTINHSSVPLTLNWLITEPFRGSGGHLGVFRMIQHLVEFGHECHVYVVPIEQMHTYNAEQIRDFVDRHFGPTGAHFHRWAGRIADADATFATYWSTATLLADLPNGGRRYYLVQDFEPYFYPMSADYVRAENSYRLGFHCITLGPWLARLMRKQYGATADHFDFALDPAIYWPQVLPRPTYPRVAFYARPSTPRRAYEIGLEALALVRQRYPEVEIILYGADLLEPPPPFHATHLGIRSQYDLATLYATCDVGLVLSLTNPSFVPFELMACKCAVVDIRSERVEGLLEDRQTALLADPTPAAIANAILELLWDKDLRSGIIERAYAQVQGKTWSHSARQIEAVLLCHAPPPEERVLARRAQGADSEALLWQIHQLLDAERDRAVELEQTHALLRRALDEKARLAEQLRTTEQTLRTLQTPTRRPRALLRQVRDEANQRAPGWRLGSMRVSKLLITQEPITQSFTAEAGGLCGVELRFAPYAAVGGELQITLHEHGPDQPALATRRLTSADLSTDEPFVFTFAPQPFANERPYVLTLVATGESSPFGLALWRAWQVNPPAGRLGRGGQPLTGQLLFQLRYERVTEHATELVHTPWPPAPQSLSMVLRQAGQRGVDEAGRLTQKTAAVVRQRGLGGLLHEARQYLRWLWIRGNGA